MPIPRKNHAASVKGRVERIHSAPRRRVISAPTARTDADWPGSVLRPLVAAAQPVTGPYVGAGASINLWHDSDTRGFRLLRDNDARFGVAERQIQHRRLQ